MTRLLQLSRKHQGTICMDGMYGWYAWMVCMDGMYGWYVCIYVWYVCMYVCMVCMYVCMCVCVGM